MCSIDFCTLKMNIDINDDAAKLVLNVSDDLTGFSDTLETTIVDCDSYDWMYKEVDELIKRGCDVLNKNRIEYSKDVRNVYEEKE